MNDQEKSVMLARVAELEIEIEAGLVEAQDVG